MFMYTYTYIYIYIERERDTHMYVCMYVYWAALLVQRYLSNTASLVLCVVRRVDDHHI